MKIKKFAKTFPAVQSQTDEVFKVMGLKVRHKNVFHSGRRFAVKFYIAFCSK